MFEHPMRYAVLAVLLVAVSGLAAAFALSALNASFVVLGAGVVMVVTPKVLVEIYKRIKAERIVEPEQTREEAVSRNSYR